MTEFQTIARKSKIDEILRKNAPGTFLQPIQEGFIESVGANSFAIKFPDASVEGEFSL